MMGKTIEILFLVPLSPSLGARSYGEETSPGSHRKIAQKRALVAAENSSCGASEFFTQDLEEL